MGLRISAIYYSTYTTRIIGSFPKVFIIVAVDSAISLLSIPFAVESNAIIIIPLRLVTACVRWIGGLGRTCNWSCGGCYSCWRVIRGASSTYTACHICRYTIIHETIIITSGTIGTLSIPCTIIIRPIDIVPPLWVIGRKWNWGWCRSGTCSEGVMKG